MPLSRRTAGQLLVFTLWARGGLSDTREPAPARSPAAAAARPAATCAWLPRAQRLHRTEIFFGRNSPQREVSEPDFRRVLGTEVTPRFPDGLTVMGARGQLRSSAGGAVELEASRRFAQQSVLRVDSVVCAGF